MSDVWTIIVSILEIRCLEFSCISFTYSKGFNSIIFVPNVEEKIHEICTNLSQQNCRSFFVICDQNLFGSYFSLMLGERKSMCIIKHSHSKNCTFLKIVLSLLLWATVAEWVKASRLTLRGHGICAGSNPRGGQSQPSFSSISWSINGYLGKPGEGKLW